MPFLSSGGHCGPSADRPGLTTIIVGTLALGVGLNAAAYAVLWRPEPDPRDCRRALAAGAPRYSVPPRERSRFAVGVRPWLAAQAA